MVELTETPAVDLPEPFETGHGALQARLRLWHAGPVTALLPYRRQTAGLGAALLAAHGLGWPEANRMSEKGGALCVWTGLDQAMLMGVAPAQGMAEHAALVDQSDSWAAVTLDGAGSADVLAQLVPIDLRTQVFPPGHAARTLLGHMPAIIFRPADGALRIMVFRSMAGTLLHELKDAMTAVAARPRT